MPSIHYNDRTLIPEYAIKKNPSGKYQARFVYEETGKRRTKKKSFSTRQLAELWWTTQKSDYEKGVILGITNKVPFETLVRQYQKEVSKSHTSLSRDKIILTRVHAWLNANNIKYASDITKGTAAQYETYRKSLNPKIKQRTVNIDIKLIAAILNHAVRYDRISFNPLSNYPYKAEQKNFKRFLSSDEIEKILNACSSKEELIVYAFLTLGLRTEELCYLQGSDIENNNVHIREKKIWIIENGKKKKIEWHPKWRSERWIDLDEEYANDHRLIEYFKTIKPSGYCFPNPSEKNGSPMNRTEVYKRIKRIIKQSGISNPEEIHTHSLRHTHISYMAARIGICRHITITKIMENVGIKDLKTLMRYAQVVKNLSKNLPDPDRFPWQTGHKKDTKRTHLNP